MLATEVTAGTLSPCRCQLKIGCRCSRATRRGMSFVVSVQSVPSVFYPYPKNVSASPSGCFRFGQARMRQASTFFRYGLNGFDGLNGLLPCSAMGLCARGAVFFLLATEVSAGTALSTPAVANKRTAALLGCENARIVLIRIVYSLCCYAASVSPHDAQ